MQARVRRDGAELLRETMPKLVENALRYGAAGRQVTAGVTANPLKIYVEDARKSRNTASAQSFVGNA
jgi:hypothetical protein